MPAPAIRSRHRSRELRRRALVKARVRTDAQWSDASILNISSRGMMIQTARPVAEGSRVEIMRGDHLIVAQVIWSAAGRSGLRCDEKLPVEDLLSLEQSRSLQLIASHGVLQDRRTSGRQAARDARDRGREMEFLAIGLIASLFAYGLWTMAQQALAGPLAAISAALGG